MTRTPREHPPTHPARSPRRRPLMPASVLVLVWVLVFAIEAPRRVRASSAEPSPAASAAEVLVGSKKFTENVILGDIAALLARDTGLQARHRRELGGTQILWKALLTGEIDLYPDYTGTITQEILAGEGIEGRAELERALEDHGVRITRPLGFNNTYALGMLEPEAQRLGIARISDLARHPQITVGFTNEFMDRADGWPALRARYSLPLEKVQGLDHDVAYKALEQGAIQVMDLYSTDAEIAYYSLRVLEDDLGHFPRYDAVFLYRADLEARAPHFVTELRALAGRIQEPAMIAMNRRAKIDRVPEPEVAADFLRRRLAREVEVVEITIAGRLWRHTREHLFLVLVSLIAAIAVAIPLGIVTARRPAAGQVILGIVGVIQTIPALALLVLLIVPMQSIGSPPAIVALFLYSLLPIVRNTATGLTAIPTGVHESAVALGLSGSARLWRIELPMAMSTILAGIKTAAVLNIGFATLGALIGAGGYGQPILTGIRRDDVGMILQGALPAAALALLAQGLFILIDRRLVPEPLRRARGGP